MIQLNRWTYGDIVRIRNKSILLFLSPPAKGAGLPGVNAFRPSIVTAAIKARLLNPGFLGTGILRLTNIAASLVGGALVARSLDINTYGIYGLILTAITIITTLSDFGGWQVLTREAAAARHLEARRNVELLLKNYFVLATIISLTGGALTGLFLSPTGLGFWSIFVVCSLGSTLVVLSNLISACLRGSGKLILGQISELVIRPLVTLGWALGVYLEFGPKGASVIEPLMGYTLAGVMGLLFAYVVYRGNLSICAPLETAKSRPVILRGGVLCAAELARSGISAVGLISLGLLGQGMELGSFRAALTIYAVSTLPSTMCNIVFGPKIARSESFGRKEELKRSYIEIALTLLIMNSIVALVFIVFGHQAINLVLGEQYEISFIPLVILMSLEAIGSMFGHPIVFLAMRNQERALLRLNLESFVIVTFSTWLFVPKLGAAGAAAALGIALTYMKTRGAWTVTRDLWGNSDQSPI